MERGVVICQFMLKSNTDNYKWQSDNKEEFVNPVQFTNCKTATQLFNACVKLAEVHKEIERQRVAKSIVAFTKDMNDSFRSNILNARRIEQFIRDTIKANIE